MKKIFVFLLLMVVSFAVKAQYPITQNLGADSTLIYVKGAVRTVGGFINGTYIDTAAANLTRIRQYQAAQIFTTGDSAIWFRMPGATKWVRIMPATPPSPNVDTSYWSLSGNYVADRVATPRLGTTTGHELNIITNDSIRLTIPVYGIRRVTGNENRYLVIDTTIGSNMYVGYMDGGSGSTYTAGNGLTLSGSQFKLGSPLTENTTITGNSNAYSLSMTGFSDLALSAGTGTNNEIDFYSSGNMIIRADEGELRFGSVSEIRALSGVLLDIVPSGASTDSILTWNATNKAVRKRQLSEVVSTYTAGNGLTLSGSQFKLGGTLTQNTNVYVDAGYNMNFDLEGSSGYFSITEDAGDTAILVRGIADVFMPNIGTVLSTTGKKVALLDNTTGKVERIDPASLVTTPNLQDVLTAGSEATVSSEIIIESLTSTVSLTSSQEVSLAVTGKSIINIIDSIAIKPHLGVANIDSLRTWSGVSDTTHKKPMTWDTRNGRWEYAANWYGGGGGTPGGSTKQFQYNNAGAFAGSGMLTQETDQILITGNSAASTPPFEVNAHEDLTAEIVNIKQSGTKKFSFHSNGSIELAETTDPTAAATGYNRLYAQSGKLYTHNDDGRVAQIVQDLQLKFGAGSGADADTTAFTTTALYGDYYTTDTIKVTSLRIVMQGTSPSVTVKIFYNDSLGVQAGATALVTAGNAVTNTTTGTNITSFDVSTIPPNVYVWAVTSTVGTKPKYLSIQLNGYRK